MGGEKNVKKGLKGCEKFVGDYHHLVQIFSDSDPDFDTDQRIGNVRNFCSGAYLRGAIAASESECRCLENC